MYVTPNLPTKAAIRRAIAAGEVVRVVANSPFDKVPTDGVVSVEGPHYPAPHAWWGRATVKGGRVVKIA